MCTYVHTYIHTHECVCVCVDDGLNCDAVVINTGERSTTLPGAMGVEGRQVVSCTECSMPNTENLQSGIIGFDKITIHYLLYVIYY